MIGRAFPPSAPCEASDAAAQPAAIGARGGAYERLLKRRDFIAAQRGRRFSTALMTVQGLYRGPNAEGAPPAPQAARLGVTVTRKVGTATERNRIKRRLRAALRLCAPRAQAGVDYVVIARRDLLAAPFESIVTDLENAMSRLGRTPMAKPTHSPDRPR
jgi:ribonuclease P protein component